VNNELNEEEEGKEDTHNKEESKHDRIVEQ